MLTENKDKNDECSLALSAGSNAFINEFCLFGNNNNSSNNSVNDAMKHNDKYLTLSSMLICITVIKSGSIV